MDEYWIDLRREMETWYSAAENERAIGDAWWTSPRGKRKPPSRGSRRFAERMRLHQSLMRRDGYFEMHYPDVISVDAAMALWEQRNPE